jgi:hypothetical protein
MSFEKKDMIKKKDHEKNEKIVKIYSIIGLACYTFHCCKRTVFQTHKMDRNEIWINCDLV